MAKGKGRRNISYKPRKPVPLGTQIRNAVECLSGLLTFGDVLMPPELQKLKKFYYSDAANRVIDTTSLPGIPEMSAHTAEVKGQVLQRMDGWEVMLGLDP